MKFHFKEMSKPLQEFWKKQKKIGNVKSTPFSGNCMLCANTLTNQDTDHSVCNICWDKLGSDNE